MEYTTIPNQKRKLEWISVMGYPHGMEYPHGKSTMRAEKKTQQGCLRETSPNRSFLTKIAGSTSLFFPIHPGRLTWNLRIHPWKRKLIFQTIIFRFYVNLRGCVYTYLYCRSFFMFQLNYIRLPEKQVSFHNLRRHKFTSQKFLCLFLSVYPISIYIYTQTKLS